MEEYLEKIFADAFKREFEQEENVVRSLPFFATALGLAVAVLQQVLVRFPAFKVTPFELTAYGLLLFEAGLFALIVYFLFEAVRASEYLYPPAEPELLAWARQLVLLEIEAGQSEAEASLSATAEVRQFYVEALAHAAHHNRAQNLRKTRARTRGLTALILLLGLAFVLAAAILFARQGAHASGEGHDGRPSRQQHASAGPRDGADQPSAAQVAPPQAPVGDHGREIPGRAGSRSGEGVRSMTDSVDPKPFPAATPAAPSSRPKPPKMQLVQKIEHGSLAQDLAVNKPRPPTDRAKDD